MSSTGIYRALMEAIEGRRSELGLSMATVNDISGVNEGYYAKMIYPDSPSGRQAQWRQVHDVVEALFGSDFEIKIVPGACENRRLASAPVIDQNISSNARNIRHWRHRRHFVELGRQGGLSRAKLGKDKLAAAARKGWKKRRAAQRAAAAHKAANEARAAT
jgi:hypothetical protein